MSGESTGPYRGISYPRFLDFRVVRWIWLRLLCPREIHLLDECLSRGWTEGHSLVCDACQLRIVIHRIDTQYVEKIK